MGVFASQGELRACLGPLFEWARYQDRVGKQLSQRRLVLQWQYRDPDDMAALDATRPSETPGAYFDVIWGPIPVTPNATLHMSADTAHRYFLNQSHALKMILDQEIRITPAGSLPLLLSLIPCILPLIREYPRVLTTIGRGDLLKAAQ
jgi:hypothetical protein